MLGRIWDTLIVLVSIGIAVGAIVTGYPLWAVVFGGLAAFTVLARARGWGRGWATPPPEEGSDRDQPGS